MEVYDSRKPSTVRFKDLHIGCVFFDNEEEIYAMRIRNFNGCANAVCLETGKLFFYRDSEEITPIKARIEVYE